MPSPRELNPPALMLARLAFALHLCLAFCGLVLVVGAVAQKRGDLGAQAAVASALAATLRWRLRKRGDLEKCTRSLDKLFESDDAAENAEAARDPDLAELIARREQMEARRGSPDFDPWALLALQHDIDERRRRVDATEGTGGGAQAPR